MEFDMAKGTCSIEGCERPHTARGWCRKHYTRWHQSGSPLGKGPRFLTVAEQFWRKVDKSAECWTWTAYVMPNGYGQFCYGPRADNHKELAHRFSYALANGPIPEGLHIDHLCRHRSCVNPTHLEAVTQKENNRRANEIRWNAWRGSLKETV